jgi:hypothetical protein
MQSRSEQRPLREARPKVNRRFWEKLITYYRANEIRYKSSFRSCQLELFREGTVTARNNPDEFSLSKANHGSYGKPRQKTLQIPLSDSDRDALVPFYEGVYDVNGPDDAVVIMLSIGCRGRGVL